MNLADAALDEFDWIVRLQELLRICLEQFNHPTDKTPLRVELLISIYLSNMDGAIEQLESHLGNIKRKIADEIGEEP